MKNRFDVIIFDWDGTLINSIDWITDCLQLAAEQCQLPKPPSQIAKNTIGLSIDKAMLSLFPEADENLLMELVTHYRKAYQSKPLGREHFFPGVYDMLVTLKQAGYQLAVATGKTRSELQKVLQATQTEALFDITRAADETASKPSPQMLQEILSHCACPSERALMVGDSIYDLEMARNANMASVAVTCGANSQTVLQQYQPLLCLQQPAELLTLINRG
ncbi:MAG: HAD-IA family hydrolase [Methylococcaceae bacterium]|nr:HAD-IA family hydrolase [Methylococcaceae bacterium]